MKPFKTGDIIEKDGRRLLLVQAIKPHDKRLFLLRTLDKKDVEFGWYSTKRLKVLGYKLTGHTDCFLPPKKGDRTTAMMLLHPELCDGGVRLELDKDKMIYATDKAVCPKCGRLTKLKTVNGKVYLRRHKKEKGNEN